MQPVNKHNSPLLCLFTFLTYHSPSFSLLPFVHLAPNIAQALSLYVNVLSCLIEAVRSINVKATNVGMT